MNRFYFKEVNGMYFIKDTTLTHFGGDHVAIGAVYPETYSKPLPEVMKIVDDLNKGSPKKLLDRHYQNPDNSKSLLSRFS